MDNHHFYDVKHLQMVPFLIGYVKFTEGTSSISEVGHHKLEVIN